MSDWKMVVNRKWARPGGLFPKVIANLSGITPGVGCDTPSPSSRTFRNREKQCVRRGQIRGPTCSGGSEVPNYQFYVFTASLIRLTAQIMGKNLSELTFIGR